MLESVTFNFTLLYFMLYMNSYVIFLDLQNVVLYMQLRINLYIFEIFNSLCLKDAHSGLYAFLH